MGCRTNPNEPWCQDRIAALERERDEAREKVIQELIEDAESYPTRRWFGVRGAHMEVARWLRDFALKERKEAPDG